MKRASATSILAAFATLKSLNDAKKYSSSSQILAEFIRYVIGNQALYSFSAVEMKNRLNSVFGFEIPEAVIKTALNNGSLTFIHKANGFYTVDKGCFSNDSLFEETKQSAENANIDIIELLSEYIKEKEPEKKISEDNLTQDFIAFLVDDQQKPAGQYTNLISEFILKNETNFAMQEKLKAIKEGSILYIGLNLNINETGSLTKNLTLFLGTEVLFSLVGFNGEIHKQLVLDFYAQVQSANANGEKIKLRYFSDTKKEIDRFFGSAESIVDGKFSAFDTVAMKCIVDSCKTVSDVAIKKADFYYTLQYSYGIVADDKDDYYTEKYHSYNLESAEYSDSQVQDSWKFVSHIHKLRRGSFQYNNADAGYLIVTNTKNTLYASKEQVEILKKEYGLDHVNDYAVSVDWMTSFLWYKLGNGFGEKRYPRNVDMVLKARIVLASSVSHNIADIYNEATNQYKNGEITSEKLAARILTLRKKPILPEELDSNSIEDIMDFSPEFLSRFEEEVSTNKTALVEKDIEIRRIEGESKVKLEKKDAIIAEKEEVIRQNSREIGELESELANYRAKDAKKFRRKQRVKQIFLFILNLGWKLGIIAIIAAVAVFCEKKFDNNILTILCALIDLVNIVYFFHTAIKKAYNKYFPRGKIK